MQGKRSGNVLWGLGSEEGAYTLHWQALLPGGTAWMAQGHWEPSSATDSTPPSLSNIPSFRFFPFSPESLLLTCGGRCPQKYFSKMRRQHLTRKGQRGVRRSGKDNGGEAMIGSFEICICPTSSDPQKTSSGPTHPLFQLACAHTSLRGEYICGHLYEAMVTNIIL